MTPWQLLLHGQHSALPRDSLFYRQVSSGYKLLSTVGYLTAEATAKENGA
jgi:hypothetical protein